MKLKKILSLMIIVCMMVSMVGCGTLDVMKDLKKETNIVSEVSDLSDFAIVDDGIDMGDTENVVDTMTSVASDTKTKEVIAYYEDANGYLVPVKTKIPWEEGIAKATVKGLVVGSNVEKKMTQVGLHGVLPEGTEIIGMSIKDGLCRIDFSQNILNTQSYEQEENMMTALAYTLTEFDTIDQVEIMVKGQILSTLTQGYAINTAFERKNINLLGKVNGVNYTVYYKAPDTEVPGYYIPMTFTADKVDNPTVTVMEKLFNGSPPDTTVSNKIPYGVNLQGVQVDKDKAIVNLGIGAVNLTEQEYEDMSKIVVLCLEQFGDISDVEFKIEGMSFEEAGLNFKDNDVTAVFNEY